MRTITVTKPPEIILIGYDDGGRKLFDVHPDEHLGDHERAAKLLKKEISRENKADRFHIDIRTVEDDRPSATLRCASQLISEGAGGYLERALKQEFQATALEYYRTATELFSQTKSA
jgi:hypothetical protein